MSSLSWWLAPHPDWEHGEDWPEGVPVVRYETDDEIALIDPLLPPAGDFDPGPKPRPRPAHAAGALPRDGGLRGAFRRIRVGAAEGAVAKAAQPRDDGRAAAGRRGDRARWKPQQVVFFIRDHATLVSGDVLSGTGGRLHVSVDDADAERLLPALDAIANLPIEQLIIPHGDAVRTDGAALLRAAVWEARRAY